MELSVPRARARRTLGALACATLAWGCARETLLTTDDGIVRARGERSRWTAREEGDWLWRYPNGELREEGRFEGGRRVGLWTQHYPNGQLRSRGARCWNPATSSSERDGPWTLWHVNGIAAEVGLYCAGARVGHWEFTNEDGSLDATRTGEYHEGEKLDGER